MLGDFTVHRADGSQVDGAAWRTGKTMDLLRLLALSNGRYVTTMSLIDKLWPHSPEDRARASLRTAASQIRRTIGVNCVSRQLGGIALPGAWVDVEAFLDLAQAASNASMAGVHARALRLARSAEFLYGGDFHAYDDDSAWAEQTRHTLERARLLMLTDAAESCVAERRFREAVHFAELAIEVDRCAEQPYRTIMEAYAELGEIDHALRAFETYRSLLAEELGADPSPITRDLHVRLLRGDHHPGTGARTTAGARG
ncbi:MAG: BTAD domain-containing putative transcriptional regulator [Nocardioides sp.]|nr:BTAD domain-containing putative transcriptional regulator [Nocardioides sp.]